MDGFIGRDSELRQLEDLFDNRTANLVVVKGRRRIGKSRLIQKFASKYTFYSFMGLNPYKGISAQDQRNEFARRLQELFKFPPLRAEDWGDLFSVLAEQAQNGRVVILLDEISWMADQSPEFLAKLKVVWDQQFKKNTDLILVLCGSVSSWIEKNIEHSTGYFGRPSLSMVLQQLPLHICKQFWFPYADQVSAFEMYKVLSVTGGVPRYLELINPKKSAEDNIRNLFFSSNSPLIDEFDKIFAEIYSSRNIVYKSIIELLIEGSKTQEDIRLALNIAQSGDFSDYLNDLEVGGFIARDRTWNIMNNRPSNLSHYRLKDNYTRFALRYIIPNIARIKQGLYEERSITSLPGWDIIMGLQFENLVISNYKKVIRLIGLRLEDVLFANPFFREKQRIYQAVRLITLFKLRTQCTFAR